MYIHVYVYKPITITLNNVTVFLSFFRMMKGKSIYFSINTMVCLPKLKNVTYVTHRQADMEIKGGIL